MADRPSKMRNTIARKERKLEREQGYHIRLFTGGDLGPALADYKAVFQASWKTNDAFAGFTDGLVDRASGAGWLRLAVLYIADRPAAAQLWLVGHGKANIYRLAYDEAWKPYSPGSILTRFMMERVIDTDGVGELDFLIGKEPYKQDWMSRYRERWKLVCVRESEPSGLVARLTDTMKRWVNRG